ncbi:MAG: hypothetical protein LH481_00670 [Burkholderiales bacterium]|nr:hypothetical protein [Burkholderiales bacterium]
MKEFKTVAFAGFEKPIRDAGLTRSAVIGEWLGNGLAEVWFSFRRQVGRLDIAKATTQAALKGRMAARHHLGSQRHAATPH